MIKIIHGSHVGFELADVREPASAEIAVKFSRLVKKAALNVPEGSGFYTLRRTAATISARSGDTFAVQRLLGHADLQMATRYVQDVSKQTDKVIENSRKYLDFMPNQDLSSLS